MKFRRRLRVVTGLACGALALAYSASPSDAQEARPNILIIVTDDQRAEGTLLVMPKTRRFFLNGGTRFSNAFATTPLCCPSRATILTGRYAHNTGVRANSPRGLDRTTLFPRRLQDAGYKTALVGKFLNSWGLRRAPPYFDRWAMIHVGSGGAYRRPKFNLDGEVRRLAGYSTDLMARKAVRFLRAFEQDDSAPWFLYVAPVAPHFPWIPAPRHADVRVPRWAGNPAVREKDRSDKPRYVRERSFNFAEGALVREGQLRTLMSVDDMVARIVEKLDALEEKRPTLAIFTSDNGFIWGDHGFGGAGGTAGEKRVPYRGSVKVPMLLRWPGHVRAGRTDSRLVGNVDIAPTVLAAAAVAPAPGEPPLDGRSLLDPAARGRILLEYWKEPTRQVPTWAALRTKRFQYVEYYDRSGARTFREYYNLMRDPWELRNLFRDGNPANNPAGKPLNAVLTRDRRCAGTNPAAGLDCP
jgi:arylsulfatase A-like enzyme